jgi:precorrin-6B methylase 1
MTLEATLAQLADAVEGVWEPVSELTLIVHEDRPRATDLAAVDALAERVSELQGEVAAARAMVRSGDVLVPGLPRLAAHLDAAQLRYWRDLRSFPAVSALRQAARRQGRELAAWQGSVEASATRCEEPFAVTVAALNACWQEICQPPMSRRSS